MKSVYGSQFESYTNSFRIRLSIIDDLRKSRGLHSVRAVGRGHVYNYIYRSMHAGVAQSRHAFVGGTVSKGAR